MQAVFYDEQSCVLLAMDVASKINRDYPDKRLDFALYGIPNGGKIPARLVADALVALGRRATTTEDADIASVLVDDIVDSGETLRRWVQGKHALTPFYALVDKRATRSLDGKWAVFYWEKDTGKDESIVSTLLNRLRNAGAPHAANDNVAKYVSAVEMSILERELTKRCGAVLDALLIDTTSDSSKGTAARMAKMYLHETMRGRYVAPPALTAFGNVRKLDELYVTGPIAVRSTCSHHMCPIIGEAWIGMLPGEELLGLSKFDRVVDHFATRGQMQEELTVQIADFLEATCKPAGLAVVIRATHTCACWRGVKASTDHAMTTSVMRGTLRGNGPARAEFFQLAKI